MDQFNKITDLVKYVEEERKEREGRFPTAMASCDSTSSVWMAHDDQSVAENKILLETLKIFMKKMYAEDHTKSETKAFFNEIICTAFYNAKLYLGDAPIGKRLLEDILDP